MPLEKYTKKCVVHYLVHLKRATNNLQQSLPYRGADSYINSITILKISTMQRK